MRCVDDRFRVFKDLIPCQPGRRVAAPDCEGVAGARRRQRLESKRRQNSCGSGIPRIRNHERPGPFMKCPKRLVLLVACHRRDPLLMRTVQGSTALTLKRRLSHHSAESRRHSVTCRPGDCPLPRFLESLTVVVATATQFGRMPGRQAQNRISAGEEFLMLAQDQSPAPATKPVSANSQKLSRLLRKRIRQLVRVALVFAICLALAPVLLRCGG